MNDCPIRSLFRVSALVLGLSLLSPAGLFAQSQDVGPDGRPLGQSAPISARSIVNTGTPESADVWRDGDGDVPGAYVRTDATTALTSRSFVADGMSALEIAAEAPGNSFQISNAGWVGLGTDSPLGRLHVVAPFGDAGTRDLLLLDETGNLEIGGVLSEASSVHLKGGIQAVNADDVLQTLLGLPVQTWNYTTDQSQARHMGLMAQDFYAAFGLGSSDESIAVLDVSGVTLAGLQALAAQVENQASTIDELREQNALLVRRLEALESR